MLFVIINLVIIICNVMNDQIFFPEVGPNFHRVELPRYWGQDLVAPQRMAKLEFTVVSDLPVPPPSSLALANNPIFLASNTYQVLRMFPHTKHTTLFMINRFLSVRVSHTHLALLYLAKVVPCGTCDSDFPGRGYKR